MRCPRGRAGCRRRSRPATHPPHRAESDPKSRCSQPHRARGPCFPESTTGASETILVQSKTLKASDPEYKALVRDLEKRIDALPEANKVQSPYQQGGKGLISPDKHSVQLSFEVPGTAVQAEKRVDASLAVTKAMQKAHPDFTVSQFGDASSEKE